MSDVVPGADSVIYANAEAAAMMLVHRWSPRIAAHFARLKAEAGAVLPVYLAFSLRKDDETLPEGCPADIVIRPSDAARVLPTRVAYAERQGEWTGSADRFSFPAMLGPLRGFESIWFVEYDVDYSGDWGRFFRDVLAMPGDYLTTHVRLRADDPDWPHWQSFMPPPGVDPSSHLASFHPIARFSRRMRAAHVEAVERGGWEGHTEALYPTIAAHSGLDVVDLGGRGPFVPEGWAERNYRAPPDPRLLSPSFGYRPPVAFRYFHEAQDSFGDRGLLHHPVKERNASGAPDLLMDLPPAVIGGFSPGPGSAGAHQPARLTVPAKIQREIRRLYRQIAGG